MSAVGTSTPSPSRGIEMAQKVWMALLVLAVLTFPLILPGYWIYFFGLLGINIIATHGLNIMTGYTGLLSAPAMQPS